MKMSYPQIARSFRRLMGNAASVLDYQPSTGSTFNDASHPDRLAFVKIYFALGIQYFLRCMRLCFFIHQTRLVFTLSGAEMERPSFLIIWNWKGFSSCCRCLIWNLPHWTMSMLEISGPVSSMRMIYFWWVTWTPFSCFLPIRNRQLDVVSIMTPRCSRQCTSSAGLVWTREFAGIGSFSQCLPTSSASFLELDLIKKSLK